MYDGNLLTAGSSWLGRSAAYISSGSRTAGMPRRGARGAAATLSACLAECVSVGLEPQLHARVMESAVSAIEYTRRILTVIWISDPLADKRWSSDCITEDKLKDTRTLREF